MIWPQSNKNWPKARSGHCMCADDNFLYVFGGYNPYVNGKMYKELWQYNTSTCNWQLLSNNDEFGPSAHASSSMVLVDNYIFIFGGTDYPFAETNTNQMFMFSLKQKKWMNTKELTLLVEKYPLNHEKIRQCGCKKIYDLVPTPKYGQAMISISGKLFIHSGTIGKEFLKELHSFDLKTFRWVSYSFCKEHSSQEPAGRYRHEVISKNGKMYIFGGATLENSFDFSKLYMYHVGFDKWESKSVGFCKKLPESRKAHSCVLYGDTMFMVGGFNENIGSLQDFWHFSLDDSEWKVINDKVRTSRSQSRFRPNSSF